MRQLFALILFLCCIIFETIGEVNQIDKPFFKDLWGYVMNWTDPEEGWSKIKRIKVLKLKEKMVLQSAAMNKYSKHGYKKMKMPKELLKKIIEVRNKAVLEPEICLIDDSSNGCHRYKTVHAVPLRNGFRQVPGNYLLKKVMSPIAILLTISVFKLVHLLFIY